MTMSGAEKAAPAAVVPQFALSIRQPWAWLIVNGFKDVENRTWPTKFRGPVWIHAGQTMTGPDFRACCLFVNGLEWAPEVWKRLIESFPSQTNLKAQCGGIVGRAEIVGCIDGNDSTDSQWFTGEWGFVMRQAAVVPFRKCKGALGFFKPKAD